MAMIPDGIPFPIGRIVVSEYERGGYIQSNSAAVDGLLALAALVLGLDDAVQREWFYREARTILASGNVAGSTPEFVYERLIEIGYSIKNG